MLYTGGTTGMPKGVMYAIGELTALLPRRLGFPLVGLPPPTDAADIAPARRRCSPPPARR